MLPDIVYFSYFYRFALFEALDQIINLVGFYYRYYYSPICRNHKSNSWKTGKYSRTLDISHVKIHYLRKRKVVTWSLERSAFHFVPWNKPLSPETTTTYRLHNCSWFVQLFRIKLPSQIVALVLEMIKLQQKSSLKTLKLHGMLFS